MLQPIPYGATARRLEWHFLPPALRRRIEGRLGSPVAEAASQGAGFTPGMASVLTCEDGSRHFVKAASVKAQRPFAAAYAEEGRKLARLPADVPAPRLRWTLADDAWVVLGIEHLDGTPVPRPWSPGHLDATLDTLETCAELLTPAPAGLAVADVATELADDVHGWEHVARTRPDDIRGLAEHHEEAAALAASHVEVTAGDTLVHTDVRDDNVLLDGAGTAWLCDWNFPVLGAAWFDTVVALVGPRGDGLDADAVLATRPPTRDVPADHVDRVLALLAGLYLAARDRPVPPTSPWLRAHQDWCAHVIFAWLAERRGWV